MPAVCCAPSNGRNAASALFYFMDVSVAKAFVERSACGLAVVQTVERATDER
jgi:hypothetical protein